jgi:mRNA interferase RelE/StbE
VHFTKEALKALKKLTKKRQLQIVEIVNMLSQNPFAVPDVKPLKGTSNDDYRVRIGP